MPKRESDIKAYWKAKKHLGALGFLLCLILLPSLDMFQCIKTSRISGGEKCLYLSHLSILLVIAKMAVIEISVYIDTLFCLFVLTYSNFSGNIAKSTQNACAIMEIESHLVLENTCV